MYINDQRDELSRFSHDRLSVCICATSISVFEISIRNFAYAIFSSHLSEPPISYLHKYRYMVATTQTEGSKSSTCMGNLFIWQDIFTKFCIDYFPRQRYNLRRNCLDRITIAYNCHTNWTIGIKCLYGIFCICEG